jgi:hypothetical protein
MQPTYRTPPGPLKTLRPSVITASEWWKEAQRNKEEWAKIRLLVLERDHYSCVYCGFQARKFMQVNHVGAEDDHSFTNLEAVCKVCHSVQHIGIESMHGTLSIIDSQADQVDIVRATRQLIWDNIPWPDIETRILEQFLSADGQVYTQDESVQFANTLLVQTQQGGYRASLEPGLAAVFHEEGEWHDFPEKVHRWGYR